MGLYPGLVVRVGGVVCLNVEKLKEMVQVEVKTQEKFAGKLADIVKNKYERQILGGVG
jgi:hypothetical protein